MNGVCGVVVMVMVAMVMVMAITMAMERGVDEWGFCTSCWIPG